MVNTNPQQAAVNQQTQSPQPPSGFEIDITELLYRLLAHWILIVCLAILGTALGGLYYTKKVTPVYQATATIYVVSRDSVVNVSDLSLGTTLTQDYIRIFRMWELHERVISNLNLPYTYSQIQGMISISNPSSTHMLDITVTNTDPELAAKIANAYASIGSEYIAETMSVDKPNIMSVALTPSNPISNSIRKYLLIGLACGLIAGFGYVFLRTILDDKVKSADDIRKYTGLTNLAIIPLDKNVTIDRKHSSHKHDQSGQSKGGQKQ